MTSMAAPDVFSDRDERHDYGAWKWANCPTDRNLLLQRSITPENLALIGLTPDMVRQAQLAEGRRIFNGLPKMGQRRLVRS